MAEYHLTVKNGVKGNAAQHSLYTSREEKYSDRNDLVYSTHGNLPSFADNSPTKFFECADKYERANGRPYKEIEFSLPRELTQEQRIELANEFAKNIVGDKHPYQLDIHCPEDRFGDEQPHAHFLFSERKLDGIERSESRFFSRANNKAPEQGGAKKDRIFSHNAFITETRKEWTRTANHYLEKHGYSVRIDDRSYADRGIDLESQHHKPDYLNKKEILANFNYRSSEEIREIQQRNGNRIIANPDTALQVLTSNNSTFTKTDLERFIFTHTDGEQQYKDAYNAVINHEQFQKIADTEKFTTKELYAIEKDIISRVRNSGENAELKHVENKQKINNDITSKRTFNPEQKEAFELLTSGKQIVSVNGAAGTGKSYVLGAVNESYQSRGFKVHGVALQGITAQSMQHDAGIESRTIASFLNQVEKGNIKLDEKTVIVLDEAGMVGSRDMQRLLEHTQTNNASIRMVGDVYQLNAVSAGSAYSTVQSELNKENQTELKNIMRQRDPEMRQASRYLSEHQTDKAVGKYTDLGKINEFKTQEGALAKTVDGWYNSDKESKCMLAYANKDVNQLNAIAREHLKEDGTLSGEAFSFETMKGSNKYATREFQNNDRILFRENNRDVGVLNGSTGNIMNINNVDGRHEVSVKLDNGEIVSFSPESYDKFTHGYATTIHGSQGMTVSESHVLLSNNMNANLAYVGMTRHKDEIQINYSKEQFPKGISDVQKELSKSEVKDFSGEKDLDYRFDELRKSYEIEKRETFTEKYNPANESQPVPEVTEQHEAKAEAPSDTTVAQEDIDRLYASENQTAPEAAEQHETKAEAPSDAAVAQEDIDRLYASENQTAPEAAEQHETKAEAPSDAAVAQEDIDRLYASENQTAPEAAEQHETKAEAQSDAAVAQEDIDRLYASENQTAPEATEQFETKAETQSDTAVAQEDIDRLYGDSEAQNDPEAAEQNGEKAEIQSNTGDENMKTVQETQDQDIGSEQAQQAVPQEDIDKLYADYEEKEQQEKVMENEQKDDAPTDRQMNM